MPASKASPSSKKAKLERGRVLISRTVLGKKALGRDCTFYGGLGLTDDGYLVHRATGRVIEQHSAPLDEAFALHILAKLERHWPALDVLAFSAFWPDASRDVLAKAIKSHKS